MSSLMDSWLLLQDFEGNGERNRVLYVLKARGMAHSNQIREFLISDRGIDLVDAYIGPSGVLTGSARVAQGDLEKAAVLASQQEAAQLKREVERKRGARTANQRAALRLRKRSLELRRIAEQVGTQHAHADHRAGGLRHLAPGGCQGGGHHAGQPPKWEGN
jgi:circadian clock protein KaiC